MTETYNVLLRQHIMQALTDPQAVNLKDFVQQLITVNEAAREDILKAYQQINEEMVGTLDA
jgi:flagellar biosynthesis regulator FlbT